jgi:hypothetical protein
VKIKPGRCKDNWAKSTQRYYGLSWCKEPCDNAGNVSDEDVAFINSLSRFLENEENCVHLFSRNIDVDIHNTCPKTDELDISSMINVLVDCTLSFTSLNLSSVFIKSSGK